MIEFALWLILVILLEEIGITYIGYEKLGRIPGLLIGLAFGRTIVVAILKQLNSTSSLRILLHQINNIPFLGEILCKALPFC